MGLELEMEFVRFFFWYEGDGDGKKGVRLMFYLLKKRPTPSLPSDRQYCSSSA